HLPLYRQQKIFARAGVKLPISTMADWVGVCGVRLQPLVDALRETILTHDVLHADETPIQVLRPDTGRKTHRAYLWAYAPGAFEDLKAVIYDFAPSRAGEHARAFLCDWRGKLVGDDLSGYKKGFTNGITEIGCMAHARRKFFKLHAANQSQLAEQALRYIGELYEIERETKALDATQRWRIRQEKAEPIAGKLHDWMLAQRMRVPDGSGTAKALDYSLKRWAALTRYLDDGCVPIDNNHIEQQIRPVALGRNKVNSVFMRSCCPLPTILSSAAGDDRDRGASHNYNDCRKFSRPFGGRYRACLSSGCFNRARARSFIARSASTYICVVDG